MNFAADALLPFFGGAALGTLFFGGLWMTVRRAALSKRAALWFAGSSLLRTAAALAGMYWLTGARWEKLLPCVAGFYIARHLVTRFTGNPLAAAAAKTAPEEDAHAS